MVLMAISLQKGQKVSLSKDNPGLSNIVVGLGWDSKKAGGFFGGGSNIDCVASVFMLGENDKILDKKDIIYFGNKHSKCGSVNHSGDNLTGDGDGDDEQISVDLSRVPAHIQKLVFVVNIYQARQRNQDFGKIKNAFIRVFNPSAGNNELVRFNLSDDYSGQTSLITGEIYRHNGEWKFNAVGQGTTDNSVDELANRYR
jgi:stress response protein SCP2